MPFLRNVGSKVFLASGTFSDGQAFKVLLKTNVLEMMMMMTTTETAGPCNVASELNVDTSD